MTTKKNEVIKKLIDNGNNPKESKTMVEKHFKTVTRIYGENTSVKNLAKIIRTYES